jgi:hypothetical protein
LALRKYQKERAEKMVYSSFFIGNMLNRYRRKFDGRLNLGKLKYGFSSVCCIIGMSKSHEKQAKRFIKHFLKETSDLYNLTHSLDNYRNKIYFISKRIKLREQNRKMQIA